MKTAKSGTSTLIGLIFFTSFFYTSCRKGEASVTDFDSESAQEASIFESSENDVDNMVGQVAQENGSIDQRLSSSAYFNSSGCAVVTRDSANHLVTIDFGTGCTGHDGRVRAGKIIIHYNGRYFDPGASWTVSYDSFYVDTRHIEGIRNVTNNGFNSNGNMNWTIDAQNMKVTRPDGSWRSWNSQRTREMVEGFGDSLFVNDEYIINGNGNGSNSRGETMTVVMTNLYRDNSCHWITAGTVEITPSSRPAKLVDFGNGNCDDQATVTVNGQTRTIRLR